MQLKKPGKYWSAIVKVEGKTRSINTRQEDYQKALKMAQGAGLEDVENIGQMNLMRSKVMGHLPGKGKRVGEAAKEWFQWLGSSAGSVRTVESYTERLTQWIDRCGVSSLQLTAVTLKHIAPYVNDPASKAKLVTRVRDTAIIGRFFKWCQHNGWVSGNPARLVKVRWDLLTHAQKSKTVKNLVSEEVLAKLLAQTKPGEFWHAAIHLGRWTGLRIGDVCNLEWRSLAEPGFLCVWTGKTNTLIRVPAVQPELVAALASIPKTDPTYCFPSQRLLYSGIYRRTIQGEFGTICRKAKVKGITSHCLRHTFATEQHRAGKSAKWIAAWVGHSDPNTTESIYIHRLEPKPEVWDYEEVV